MRLSFLFVIGLCWCNFLFSQNSKPNYPFAVSESFQAENRVRSGMALGGIGTGSIELRKDGNFYNWSIFNNYPFSTGTPFQLHNYPNSDDTSSLLFFLVRYQVEGESPKLKLLQLNDGSNEAAMESVIYYYPWLSGVDRITYEATFPFVHMTFADDEMPFEVKLRAFSPFIPHDVKNSSLPGVYFDFEIRSKTDKKVEVTLIGTLRNLIGYDIFDKAFESDIHQDENFTLFVHKAAGLDEHHFSNGQMGLGVVSEEEISYYLGWEHKHPFYERLLVHNSLGNIDDTHNRNVSTEDNKKIGRFSFMSNDQRCFSSIGVSKALQKNEPLKATLFMVWDFPNNYGAHKGDQPSLPNQPMERDNFLNLEKTKIVGHYHNRFFKSAKEVASYMVENSEDLSFRTGHFLEGFYQSDVPQNVLNLVNAQCNTLITSSTLTKGGTFLIREGLTASRAWGPNATIDVSLYGSVLTLALFPELQKSMMKAHQKLQTSAGEINHGISNDPDFLHNGTWGVYDRLDLVPNYIQLVLRDYRWTNDMDYLREMWPSIKKGINYVLSHRDKDGDQMPEMDGIMCSYDNFPMYGLSSYIQSQWICALQMVSKAAEELGDQEFSVKCADIANKGMELMETKLWNGRYYRLSNDYLGDKGIDEGCLTDQLIGQWVAHTAGVGQLFPRKRVRSALNSILELSTIDDSFVRNCTWPEYPDMFPIHKSDLWVDQANTPWTGVELGLAAFLIYEGMVAEGEKVINGVDQRYRKAGLHWDHQEFGGHYYRPLSAWSIINAYAGFYLVQDQYVFDPKITAEDFTLFVASSEGTAHLIVEKDVIRFRNHSGKQRIKSLQLPSDLMKDKNLIRLSDNATIANYEKAEDGKFTKIKFENEIILCNGHELLIEKGEVK